MSHVGELYIHTEIQHIMKSMRKAVQFTSDWGGIYKPVELLWNTATTVLPVLLLLRALQIVFHLSRLQKGIVNNSSLLSEVVFSVIQVY